MTHTVVVNDCSAVAVTGGPISIRTRDTEVGGRNFVLNFSDLAAGLARQLSERELDWIETLGNIFAIDLACVRGRGDVGWPRSITAHLPVRDPEYWNGVATRLENIFSDFTFDRLELHFELDSTPDLAPRQRRRPFPQHDCVSLLSGGVDSFVGTLRLVDRGCRPLAVSHTAAGSISHAQSEAETVLRHRYQEFERLGLTAKRSGTSFPGPEPSQRSRSLLFLGAASLVAAVGGSSTVYINENGVMAIHLPMTAARIGGLSTHTASPVILERVEGLAQEVLSAPVAIHNDLLSFTKPEVVRFGMDSGVSDALKKTVSCWSIGRTNRHCGICAPCLMRRISFDLHGTPDVQYVDDALHDAGVLDNDFACDNLTHLIRLVDDLNDLSDLALQLNYPELLNGGKQLTLSNTIGLHRRWAKEAESVLFNSPVPVILR
jgi:7-cyano-7-deazaguanine synthase in queuosine biosynthesis